jgi:hypothetical protein
MAPGEETLPMNTFKGLVYVKYGNVGTKSEGPVYFLQTAQGDVGLEYNVKQAWETDFELEFYGRRMVEVQGEYDAERRLLHVRKGGIREILSPNIPQ